MPSAHGNNPVQGNQNVRFMQEQEIKEIKIVNLPRDLKEETTNVKEKKEFDLIPDQYTTTPLYSLYNPYANFPYIKKQFYSRSPLKGRGMTNIRHVAGEYKIRFAFDPTDFNRARSDEVIGREAISSEQRGGGLKRILYNQQQDVRQSNNMETSKKSQIHYSGNISGGKEINLKMGMNIKKESSPQYAPHYNEISRKNIRNLVSSHEKVLSSGNINISRYKLLNSRVAQAIKDTYFEHEKNENLNQNNEDVDSRKIKKKSEKNGNKKDEHANEDENINEVSGIFRTPGKAQTPIIRPDKNIKSHKDEIKDLKHSNKIDKEDKNEDKRFVMSTTEKDEEKDNENKWNKEAIQGNTNQWEKGSTKKKHENISSDISSKRKRDENVKSTTRNLSYPDKESESEERGKKWINYFSKTSNLDSVNEVNEENLNESKSIKNKRQSTSDLPDILDNNYILEYTIDDEDNPIIVGKRFLTLLDEKNKSQEYPKGKLIKINNILYLKDDIPYSKEEYSQIQIKVIINSDGRKIIVDQDNIPIPEIENGNFYIPLINEKKKNNNIINIIQKIAHNGEKKLIRNDTEEEVKIAFIRKINFKNPNEFIIFKIDLREFSDLLEIVNLKILKKTDLRTGREYLIDIDSNKEIKGYIKELNENGEGYFVKKKKKII
jgi:hypothetical protein